MTISLVSSIGLPLSCMVLALIATLFDNHLWCLICLFVQSRLFGMMSAIYDTDSIEKSNSIVIGFIYFVNALLYLLTAFAIWYRPHISNLRQRPKRGCIFVSGCDSGMGKATVIQLAQSNVLHKNSNSVQRGKVMLQSKTAGSQYEQIFAGCFDPKVARQQFADELTEEEFKFITVVELDVTDSDNVNEAARTVREWIYTHNKNKNHKFGLTGLIQYHGVAFNGPSSYMPIDMYRRQMDVNFLGTIRIVQALLPLLKESIKDRKDLGGGGDTYRGRIVLTGTGGGCCSPCPPLLTAYMSSKFAVEAYAQSLRQELYMTSIPIDLSVINPGFVKPTMLIEVGTKISSSMWKACEEKLGSTQAKDEYGNMLDHFTKYSALQPGTHVSKVVEAATEHALLSQIPRSSYKVGIDSKLAPIVGMMPTGVREFITRHGIYGKLSPAGTVTGYKVN